MTDVLRCLTQDLGTSSDKEDIARVDLLAEAFFNLFDDLKVRRFQFILAASSSALREPARRLGTRLRSSSRLSLMAVLYSLSALLWFILYLPTLGSSLVGTTSTSEGTSGLSDKVTGVGGIDS